MHSETFTCEVITPMFLGGADNSLQAEPELRPPSIRGAMRWWFRAMMGGIIENNIDGLKRLESVVFGSNEKSSAITVRIKVVFGSNEKSSAITVRIKQDKLTTDYYPPLPHKENLFKKKAFSSNQGVIITVKLNPWVKENKQEIFNAAVESLKLLLTFGGLGNRSRRGFGSLHWNNGKTEKEILDEAKKVFEDLYEIENAKKAITKNPWRITLPEFPCIVENFFSVYETYFQNEWKKKLSDLMNKMSDFKKTSTSKNALGSENPRQSSPLIVHAKKSGDGIKLLFTYFRCKLAFDPEVTTADMDMLENYVIENYLKVF